MTPADTMRAAVEALKGMLAERSHAAQLSDACYEARSALSLLRSALEQGEPQPVAWAIYDSQGFYEASLDEESARRFCDHYNKREPSDPLRPYRCGPLYATIPPNPLPDEVLQLLNHIEDVVGDEAWARIDAQMWNAVTALPTQDEVREAMQASTQDTVPGWADDVLRRAPAGVAPPRQYLHPTRVDALITVLEGECDGLTVTRETAEAILHYLENAPAGVAVNYTDEPWQDAMLAKFAAAGFKFDGNGGWQAELTTTDLLALGAALGVGGTEAPDSVDLASLRGSVAYLRSVATTEGQRAALDNIERRARAAAGVAGTQGDKA